MPFEPYVDQELVINAVAYRIAEHPAAPGMPFGQEGRQAVVYQLSAKDDVRALKVFRPRFRAPSLVSLADQIAPLASLPGLQVCQRVVLTPSRHAELLRAFPDLIYAVLMPWVEGPVWQEVLLGKRTLTPEQSLGLARALSRVLLTMEERGVAHCDLSAPNLIVSPNLDRAAVALVDVEGIYAPGLPRPGILPAGSPGYAHKTAPRGLWNTEADRFAGAVLLAEILGWSSPDVRQAAWGENYFSAQEMQLENERCQILVACLRRHWGDTVANLFARAWYSDTLVDCPTLGEWFVGLPETAPVPAARVDESVPASIEAQVIRLVMQAEQAAGRGEAATALDLYQQAVAMAPPELVEEITARLRTLRPTPEPAGPRCQHCGRELAAGLEVCPYCERAREEAAASPEEAPPPPTWRCPNCGRHAPAEMEVCPHCERGKRDGTVIARARPQVPKAPAAREPPATFWSCPNCNLVAPPARDVCPHCKRGRRDGTIIGAPARVPVEPAAPPEPEPTSAPAAAPEGVTLSRFARWAPVLLLAVGWALGWYVGRGAALSLLNRWIATQGPIPSNLHHALVSALAGAFVGLVTGLTLTWTEGSVRIRQVLLLALGWAVGSAASSWLAVTFMPRSLWEVSLAGSLLTAVGGVIGGLITGLILRRCDSLPRWGQLIWVTAGYAVAWCLASMGSLQLFRALRDSSLALANMGQILVFGVVAGVIGGGGLYWQLGRLTGRGPAVVASAEPRPSPTIRRFATLTAMGWGGGWALGHVLGGLLFVLVVDRMISFSLMTAVSGLITGAVLGVATAWLLGRLGYPLSGREWLILAVVWAVAGGAAMVLVSSPAGTALADAVGWRRVSYVFVRKYGHMGPRGFRMAGWFLGWLLAALAAGVTIGCLSRPARRPMPWRRALALAAGFALAWGVALFAAELAIEYLLMPIERSLRFGIPLTDIAIDLLTGALAGATAGAVLYRQLARGRPDQRGPSA